MMKLLLKIKRKWVKLRLQPIRVYCFHHISALFDANIMKANDWKDVNEFKCHIQNQLDSGISFIPLYEAYIHICKDKLRRKKYSVLTFDDGYASLFEILPWLQEKKIPCTLFINGKYLDGISYRENPLEKYLSLSDIEHIIQIYGSLVDIQSHGWEHNDAVKMPPNEFETSLINNVQLLSKITNRPIHFHAYTWGSYSKETDEVVNKLGMIPVRINGRLNYNDSTCVERM